MNCLVGLSFASADLRYAELLYAVLTERLGKTRKGLDANGNPIDVENVYFYRTKPAFIDQNLEQQLKQEFESCNVIVAVIGPTYDKSGACQTEANVILDRIGSGNLNGVIIAVVDGNAASLPSLLGNKVSFANVATLPLKQGTSSWGGFCDIRVLARIVYAKLGNALPENPRYSKAPRSLPGAVECHFGQNFQKVVQTAKPKSHEHGLKVSARFLHHLQQDARAELVCESLRVLSGLCQLNSTAMPAKDLDFAFNEIREQIVDLLKIFALEAERDSLRRLDVLGALLSRFEDYLRRHFRNDGSRVKMLVGYLSNLALPEERPTAVFRTSTTGLRYQSKSFSEDIERTFLSRNRFSGRIDDATELEDFGIQQDEYLERDEPKYAYGVNP